MRTTTFNIYNNKTIEIFAKPRASIYAGFEVWIVGDINGQRTVLSHFLTHQNFEPFLAYSIAGDLIWRNADSSAIPRHKTQVAEEEEQILREGRFLDMDSFLYYFGGTHSIPCDRKILNFAKKALIGAWTDGIATVVFSPNSKLKIRCSDAPSHPLYYAVYKQHVNWWNFARWQLFLMNGRKTSGERMGVWRCDERELHIVSKQRDRLAHVFHRLPSSEASLGKG